MTISDNKGKVLIFNTLSKQKELLKPYIVMYPKSNSIRNERSTHMKTKQELENIKEEIENLNQLKRKFRQTTKIL